MRDRILIVVALHTGRRAEELCDLAPSHGKIAKRSGYLKVWGKRGKYGEVPLNCTAREALFEWIAELPEGAPCLFPSRKRERSADGKRKLRPVTDRALGHVVSKYAALAKVEDVSPQGPRYRFGYAMAERVPLHRLAQIMGHDSLDTTTVYVRGTQGDLRRAVEERAWA